MKSDNKDMIDDFSSFRSRFEYFLNITNPYLLTFSNDQILQSEKYPQNFPKYLRSSAIHPTSKEIIPSLYRVSAIAPVNIPIVWAMLICPSTNVAGTLGLHFINQSYNTACNYFNRAGNQIDVSQMSKAYLLAVSSACGLAYGFGKLVQKGPPIIRNFGIMIPCVASAAASCSNLALTRYDEIANGCAVFDSEGVVHGTSLIAGKEGVAKTAITRCVLVPFSCLLLPPAVIHVLSKFRMMPKSKTTATLIELGLIYLSLQLGLPAALAVYPPTLSFPVEKLESKFSNLTSKNGEKIQTLYSNKGL